MDRVQLATKPTAVKAMRSTMWFVRVDGNHGWLEAKLKQFAEKIDVKAMLCALHVGSKKDNPHCHFVVEMSSEVQKQSYAVRVKNHFEITKKTEYAIDIWDGERGAGACSYLFHEEDAKIVINKGFTEDDLQRARDANVAVQKVVAVNKEKASKNLVGRALEHFQDKKNMPYMKVEILTWMLQEIKEGNHYYPGEYRLKQFVEEVELGLNDNMEEFAYCMAKRLWKE